MKSWVRTELGVLVWLGAFAGASFAWDERR